MSDDQVECEWVSVSSGTGLPGLSRTKAVNRLCVYVFFYVFGRCFHSFWSSLFLGVFCTEQFPKILACCCEKHLATMEGTTCIELRERLLVSWHHCDYII